MGRRYFLLSFVLAGPWHGAAQPVQVNAPVIEDAHVATQGSSYRFVFTKVDGRRHSDSVALGEVELLGASGGPLHIYSIANPGGAHKVTQNAERAIDGTPMTKWIDSNYEIPAPGLAEYNTSILQFTLANQAQEVVGYRLYTANDAPLRDPVSWRFERQASSGVAWHTLHQIDEFQAPIARSTSYLPGSDAFWITAPPPAPPRPEYRLLVTATRDIPHLSDSCALGEVILWTGHPFVAPIYATSNPGGNNPRSQGPSAAVDSLKRTKWLDITFATTRRSELRFTLDADVDIHSYELVTGGRRMDTPVARSTHRDIT